MLNTKANFVLSQLLLIDHKFQGFHVRPLPHMQVVSVRYSLHDLGSADESTSSDDTGSKLLVVSLEEHHIQEEAAEVQSILAFLKAEAPEEEFQEAHGSGHIQLEVNGGQKFDLKLLHNLTHERLRLNAA
jgi:hypothetical protein